MSLVYFGQHAIKDGRLEEAKRASEELVEFVEANHDRFLQFAISIDHEKRLMTVIQVHPDEDSLRQHAVLAGDRIRAAYSFLEETIRIDIFGDPSDQLIEQITQMAAGAPVEYHRPLAGFDRYVATRPV